MEPLYHIDEHVCVFVAAELLLMTHIWTFANKTATTIKATFSSSPLLIYI